MWKPGPEVLYSHKSKKQKNDNNVEKTPVLKGHTHTQLNMKQ